jgi:GT2 family glycosyltransferase
VVRLSIIVPATGPQAVLDDTLVSVLENRPKDCEVIVPRPSTYLDPYQLDDEVRFVTAAHDDLVSLFNAGIDASRTELLHLLRSGVEATEGWTEPALARLEADPQLAAVAPLIVDGHQSRVVAAGVRYRVGGTKQIVGAGHRRSRSTARSYVVDGPCLEAGFFRRSALLTIGHFDSDLGSYYCDVDAAAKFHRLGLRCAHEPQSVLRGAPIRRPKGFRAGHEAELLFWRHWAHRGHAAALIGHAGVSCAEGLGHIWYPRGIALLAGRLWGLAECLLRGRRAWEPERPFPERNDCCDADFPATIPLAEGKRRRPVGQNPTTRYSKTA